MALFKLYEPNVWNNVQIFWLIEYRRRNIELQRVRAQRVRSFVQDWPSEDNNPEMAIYYDDENIPLYPTPGEDSADRIIHSIIDETFPGIVDAEEFVVNTVSFEITKDQFTHDNDPVIVARFHPKAPKELVLNDISLFMDHYSQKKTLRVTSQYSIKENGDPYDPGDSNTLTPGRTIVVSTKAANYIQGVRYNKASDAPRAVGLWLYDYIERTRSTQSQAIAALEGTQYLSRLGLTPGDEDLRFYFRRTRECVQQKKLLAFTKKGTRRIGLVPRTKRKA